MAAAGRRGGRGGLLLCKGDVLFSTRRGFGGGPCGTRGGARAAGSRRGSNFAPPPQPPRARHSCQGLAGCPCYGWAAPCLAPFRSECLQRFYSGAWWIPRPLVDAFHLLVLGRRKLGCRWQPQLLSAFLCSEVNAWISIQRICRVQNACSEIEPDIPTSKSLSLVKFLYTTGWTILIPLLLHTTVWEEVVCKLQQQMPHS